MQSHGEFQKHTNGAGLLDLKTGLKKLPLKIGISVTCWFYMFVIHILKWIVLHNLRWVYLRGWSAEMEVVILDNHLNSIFFTSPSLVDLSGRFPSRLSTANLTPLFNTFSSTVATTETIFVFSVFLPSFFHLSSKFVRFLDWVDQKLEKWITTKIIRLMGSRKISSYFQIWVSMCFDLPNDCF